jgi:hypothetical protein
MSNRASIPIGLIQNLRGPRILCGVLGKDINPTVACWKWMYLRNLKDEIGIPSPLLHAAAADLV